MKKQAAGATYTQATIEEWDSFVNRTFHALHPKRGAIHGEIVFDLYLTQRVGIQIRTTVPTEGGETRKAGADIIQLMLMDFGRNKIMITRDMIQKVKRTKNWRDGVVDRVENLVELFDEHEAEIERGGFIQWRMKPGEKPPKPEAEPETV